MFLGLLHFCNLHYIWKKFSNWTICQMLIFICYFWLWSWLPPGQYIAISSPHYTWNFIFIKWLIIANIANICILLSPIVSWFQNHPGCWNKTFSYKKNILIKSKNIFFKILSIIKSWIDTSFQREYQQF